MATAVCSVKRGNREVGGTADLSDNLEDGYAVSVPTNLPSRSEADAESSTGTFREGPGPAALGNERDEGWCAPGRESGVARPNKPSAAFSCHYCSFVTTCLSKLRQHTEVHSGEMPFKCTVCSSLFSEESNFKLHMSRHDVDKSIMDYNITRTSKGYECSLCPYVTSYRKDVVNHVRTHTGEKPYKCDKCSYASCFRSAVKRHELRRHKSAASSV